MVLFLCCSASLALAAVWQTRGEAQAASPEKLVQGEWATLYEGLFNKSLYSYQPSVNSWGILNYVLFREGKDGVLIGENDWLFTKEEFDYRADVHRQVQAKIEFVALVRDMLHKKNIRLVVALVPSKARLYEDYLGRYEFPSYKEDVYGMFAGALSGRGIVVADILAAMRAEEEQEMFLRTDTHWTPAGARLAAGTVAAAIKERMPELTLEDREYETVVTGRKLYEGDLLRYVPLGDLSALIGPDPDRLPVMETKEKEKERNRAAMADALFAENAPPVTLVGTSYSADPLWNFEGFLKEALRSDILNASDEGRGPFETMKQYLNDQAFRQTPPEIVIWEIPERYLPFSYDLKLKTPEEDV